MKTFPVCSSCSENVDGGFSVCLFVGFVVTFCLVEVFFNSVSVLLFYHLWSYFVVGS